MIGHRIRLHVPGQTALIIGMASWGGIALAEPALLVSNQGGCEVLRFDPDTGEYLGVHVPRGTMLGSSGMAVGEDCSLYVAGEGTHSIPRYDLQTGEFIDTFVGWRVGGLSRPTYFSINSTGTCSAVMRGATAAAAAPGGDGNLYVMSKDADSVLRFKGATSVFSIAAAGGTDPCPAALPGEPCPGPRVAECPEGVTACFIPPVSEVFLQNPFKPFWDADGNIHATMPGPACQSHKRFDGVTAEEIPTQRAIDQGYPLDYVAPGDGGLPRPGSGTVGPFGNIYIPLRDYSDGTPCPVEAAVMRFAGPLPAGVAPGDPGDVRGPCIGLPEAAPCPGPLWSGDPDIAVFAPGECMALVGARFGPDGNIYLNHIYSPERHPPTLRHRVLRFAGPLPPGVAPGDPGDTRGGCFALPPGDACPGPLATDTAEFLPSRYGDGETHNLLIPWDFVWADLPPVEPCIHANDACLTAEVLESDYELSVPFDNTCATGGQSVSGVNCEIEGWQFKYDIWYSYTAPDSGVLFIDAASSVTCVLDYDDHPEAPGCALDTGLAVYGGLAYCTCSDPNQPLFCRGDLYPARDSPSAIRVPVQKDMCYKIRLGGDHQTVTPAGPTGVGTLRLSLRPHALEPEPVSRLAWDDGWPEAEIGATGTPFGWANQFQNTSPDEVIIDEIEIATHSIPGDALDAVIWVDESATGDMVNATMAVRWSIPGGARDALEGTSWVYQVPGGGVAVPPGAEYYVGLLDIQTQQDLRERYPAFQDTGTFARRSWAFFGDPLDPDDLPSQTLGLIEDLAAPGFDLRGNFLIRARTSVDTRNRYLSMVVPIAGAGSQTALRVELSSLYHPDPPPSLGAMPDFSVFEGQYRYVNTLRDAAGNPVFDCPDSISGGTSFRCAILGCTPEYRYWADELNGEVLYLVGGEIMPDSGYEVTQLVEACAGQEETCAQVSPGLQLLTSRWADVAPAYHLPNGSPQPDFNDIALVVATFVDEPGAPIKVRAQLQPNVALPGRGVDFKDIAAAVQAFVGNTYTDSIGATGPCTCPSSVTCGATTCTTDLQCGGGYCLYGVCTDACGRCSS